jgi:chaperonin cofactor prefoldin
MNIDERLDRLTERHEALTQSVELLRLQSQETDKQIAKLGEYINKIVRILESHEDRLLRLEVGPV